MFNSKAQQEAVFNLVESMDWAIDRAQKSLDDFAEKMVANPLDSFAWGDEAVQDAATVTVKKNWSRLLMDPERSFDELHKRLLGEVLRKSQFPARSTSVMHNISSVCEAKAMADLLEEFDSTARLITKLEMEAK